MNDKQSERIIDVRNISFSYDDYQVYEDISFHVDSGDIFCLMGPNGCGKTTVIDTVLGIHKPDKGDISLCGRLLLSYKRHEIAQRIAYVPQLHTVTFPFSVLQVVLMGRTSYTGVFGEPKEEDEIIAMEALEKVGMAEYADRPYDLLSGGEIKLVLLARALGQKTPLIVLDEPTAHLDFKNELIFLETIAEICAKEHKAVLMATHMPHHAFYFDSMGLPVYAGLMKRQHKGFCALDKAAKIITEENIADVYQVRSQIVSGYENGRESKAIALFGTLKKQETEK